MALPHGSDPVTGIETGLLETLRRGQSREVLDSVAFLEFSMYMRHTLLRDADAFSMAQPLELRLPLLEHPVVAIASRARAEWRRSDPRPKPLLIERRRSPAYPATYGSEEARLCAPMGIVVTGTAGAPGCGLAWLATNLGRARLGCGCRGRFWDRFQLHDEPSLPSACWL